MSHDLLAELQGYRNELDSAVRRGASERAAAVRGEIARVTAEVRARVAQLLARAENHEEDGQDVLAAQCRVEAKRLARSVPAEAPATETAADSTPRETATTRRGRKESA